MTTSRFLIGLALIALALTVGDLATNTDPAANLANSIGYGLGGVAGGLIWGVVVWVGFRLVRGKGAAPDIRKVSLYTTAILALLFIVMGMVFGVI